MTFLTFEKAAYNTAKLLADLFALYPGEIVSITLINDRVVLVLAGDPDQDTIDAIGALIIAHDPTELTPDQEADAAGRLDVAALLAEIATQRAWLQDKLANWATLTQADQIAVLRRDTVIIDAMLGAFAFLLRHVPLG